MRIKPSCRASWLAPNQDGRAQHRQVWNRGDGAVPVIPQRCGQCGGQLSSAPAWPFCADDSDRSSHVCVCSPRSQDSVPHHPARLAQQLLILSCFPPATNMAQSISLALNTD